MTPPHILIAIHDFNAGGTETIAFRLARAWLGRGCRVSVLAGAPDGPVRSQVPAGADVIVRDPPVRRSPLSRLKLGPALAPLAAKIAPDAIFLPGNFHFVLARAFKQLLPNVPIVGKISNPLLPLAEFIPVALQRPLLRRWTSGIDALAAMSQGLEQDAHRLLPDRLVATLHDPFLDEEEEAPPPRSPPDPSKPLHLLAVGRLEPQKDFALAVDTLAELRRLRPAHLTILGEGPERAQLVRQVARLGLTDAAFLPGRTNATAAAYDRADLLLISSRYEGGPAVAVEGLARGLRFASTDCSHLLRELADAGLGTLASARTPRALAEAVERALSLPPPPPKRVEALIGRHRLSRAADAYLALFAQ